MAQPPKQPQPGPSSRPSAPSPPGSPLPTSPPPPAYGDSLDHFNLSQAGFQAGAALTEDGRINIQISEKNHRLSQLLAPALRNQLLGQPPSPATGPLPPPYIPASLGGQPGQTPPPRLNVVIQIVGSRGDVQPFVSLGQTLKQTYGHRVRVATHPVFKEFVEESGLEFFSIGGDPAELMAFMVKHPGLMPGFDAIKTGEITKRRKGVYEVLMGCWRSCIEAGDGTGPAPKEWKKGDRNAEGAFIGEDGWTVSGDAGVGMGRKPFVADAIIANPPSFAHIHCAEKLGVPLHMMFTMPWSPTKAFAHPLANIQSSNADVAITNYISYALVEMMTWQGLGDVINRFREKVLDLEPLSLLWAPGLLNRLRIPTTYCWSPALIPKPNDWAQEISVAGFYFLDLATNYTPEPDLAAFLAAGPPPIYIGFGSIVVDDPDALTRLILRAVAKSGVRALISKGWGGIGLTQDITQADWAPRPDQYFMLGNCPHDWLFNRVSAVVHHGGAGTSAAGIKAGKPTVVVPFFGDQPFWGAMIAKAGAGPKPIPNKELTADNLAAAIQEALKPETLARAKELGNRIKEEKGADEGGKSFHQFLEVDGMRCSLSPSRVATWRVRRTKVRLSAFAAEVLVREGFLKYSDLKLYRAKEHVTDGQPWDPISAVTAALVEDLGTMAMSVADFPRQIFKTNQGRRASNVAGGNGQGSGSDTPADGAHEASSPQARGALSPEGQSGSSYFPPTFEEASRPSSSAKGKGRPVPSASDSRQGSSMGSSNQRSASGGQRPSTPGGTANIFGAASPQLNLEALNYETVLDAGRNVGRFVDTGMKMPMNVCLGLARGFRNAPRLYNDDTVRPQEKVTDFASGLRVATKEFGFGLFDGISGLVTQPMRGAEKEGAMGLLKGFAKGIGGVALKPAAGFWSIPAYAMQGLNAEVRNLLRGGGWVNHIIAARAQQGREEIEYATKEEVKDVVARWQQKRWEDPAKGGLRDWVKTDVLGKGKGVASPGTTAGGAGSGSSQGQARSGVAAAVGASNDAELEKAIQASIQQTSRGDAEEDAQIEAAIRLSLAQMQHETTWQAQQPPQYDGSVPARYEELKSPPGAWPQAASGPPSSADVASPGAPPPAYSAEYQHQPPPEKSSLAQAMIDEYFTGISDEEHQALIEEAVQRSIRAQMYQQSTMSAKEEKELQKAIEASKSAYTFGVPPPLPARQFSGFTPIATPTTPNNGETGEDPEEEEEMRKALEESERMDRERREQEEREKNEEAIVLEWVKKQSLAEERFRGGTSQRGLGGGEGSGSGGGQRQGQTQGQTQVQAPVEVSQAQQRREQVQSEGQGQTDTHHGPIQMEDRDFDEEEEFRRALEESLRMSGQRDAKGQ